MYTCMHVRMYVRMYVCMYVCIIVCMYVFWVYLRIVCIHPHIMHVHDVSEAKQNGTNMCVYELPTYQGRGAAPEPCHRASATPDVPLQRLV